MNLRIAANWDQKLLDNINGLPVKSMFGILPSDLVGGGRPTAALSKVKKEDAENYIKEIRSRGISFNYLMNAACLDNMEFTKEWNNNFIMHLEWLNSIGVDSLTIATPYLIQVVKKRYPGMKVCTSIFARINTVERAKYFEKIGADDIVIDPNINRELALIKKMRKALKTEMTVLVNGHCLYQCPYSFYHAEQLAHSSQSGHPSKGYYIEYCWYSCMKTRLENPLELIKAIWVRPEDLSRYEELGVENFKIGDRTASTEYILKTVKAYSNRRLDGNLMELFNIPTPMIKFVLAKYMKPGFNPALPYIDNRALDGFLEFFEKKSCSLSDCDECRYCDRLAAKAIKITPEVMETAVCFKKALEDVISGKTISEGSF